MNLVDRLETFAERPAAVWLLGAWAAAEAIALPIVPDVGLCLLALAAPRAAPRLFGGVLAGALIGSGIMAGLATADPAAVRAMLLALPAIDGAMLIDVERAVADQGTVAFAQVGPGPPLKVYTAAWIGDGGDLPGLLLGVVVNRMTRIGPVVVVAALAGIALGRWWRAHDRLTMSGYVLAWVAFYAIYLG